VYIPFVRKKSTVFQTCNSLAKNILNRTETECYLRQWSGFLHYPICARLYDKLLVTHKKTHFTFLIHRQLCWIVVCYCKDPL